ncbi:hypothetical protein [Moorena sp. SIOASIH]|nr:hypothetical protein [Moorena sp. SIOASIH]
MVFSVVILVKRLEFLPNYKRNCSYSRLPTPDSLLPVPYINLVNL